MTHRNDLDVLADFGRADVRDEATNRERRSELMGGLPGRVVACEPEELMAQLRDPGAPPPFPRFALGAGLALLLLGAVASFV